MEKINKIESTAVPLPLDNVDTDQIIPARFLKNVEDFDYGSALFRDWRYAEDKIDPEFWLNQDKFSGKVLVTQSNFGCGSSREHAAWAIKQYGFKVVVAGSFADIFRNNALNNGVLPVEIGLEKAKTLCKKILENPKTKIFVDLQDQKVSSNCEIETKFEIDLFKKQCLLYGINEMEFLNQLKPDIEALEAKINLYA